MVVLGYHGTSRVVAEGLVSGALEWRPSTNEGDWLGFGSYFFQDGPDRARFWANHHCTDPVVIEAEISLANTLDLLDLADWKTLSAFALQAQRSGAVIPSQDEFVVEGGRCIPPKSVDPLQLRNKQDRYLVDFCVAQLTPTRPIDCVRSAFIWGRAITKHSALFNWARVEIAVRQPATAIRASRIL